MDERKAKAIVIKEIGTTYTISLFRNTPKAYIFKCDASDPEAIPGVVLVAVNKETENTGSSMTDPTEAFNLCLKG